MCMEQALGIVALLFMLGAFLLSVFFLLSLASYRIGWGWVRFNESPPSGHGAHYAKDEKRKSRNLTNAEIIAMSPVCSES